MFTAALFVIAPNQNQLKCLSAGEWLNKLWYSSPLLAMVLLSMVNCGPKILNGKIQK